MSTRGASRGRGGPRGRGARGAASSRGRGGAASNKANNAEGKNTATETKTTAETKTTTGARGRGRGRGANKPVPQTRMEKKIAEATSAAGFDESSLASLFVADDNNKTDNNNTKNNAATNKTNNNKKKRNLTEMKSEDVPMADNNKTLEPEVKRKRMQQREDTRLMGKTNRLFIHQVDQDTTEEDLTQLIEQETQIKPKAIRFLAKSYIKKADIVFGTDEQAAKVREKLNGTTFKGHTLVVGNVKPFIERPPRQELSGTTSEVKVMGLSLETTPEDITAAIQEYCGDEIVPKEVIPIRDRKGYEVGMIKIVLNSSEEATTVQQQLHHKVIKGKTARVDYWAQSRFLKKQEVAPQEGEEKQQEA